MPYGDPLSQIGNAKGGAAELYLGTLRYIEAQGEQTGRASSENAVVSVASRPSQKSQPEPITINYTASSGAGSFGMDPMVSQASVIHELAYGRISSTVPQSTRNSGYPIPSDMATHQLDLIA
jgi:hypothetical protein